MRLLSNRENSAAQTWLISSAVWLVVGTMWGILDAIHLAAPDMLGSHAALTFGRMRPTHVNTIVFGFVGMSLVGSCLYMAPAVLKTRLWGERLANLAMWLFNGAVLGGVITLPMGLTQAREYAEYIWPLDVLVELALLSLGVCLLGTLANRKEKTLYVTVWYTAGGVIWTIFLYFIGNAMWHPDTGSIDGTMDAILLWYYGHNILGLFLTPLATAIYYYCIPRLAKAPLYSHTLSLVGFWTLLFFYTHIGTHHLLQAPVPLWLKEISIVDSVCMLIPVITVLSNLWLTMSGRLSVVRETPAGRILFASTIWYLVVSMQGSMQSLPAVQRYTHFTNWVIGHAHIALLGFAGLAGLGGLWYVLPRACGRKIWSETLVDIQYWLLMIGVTGFFLVLTAAGLIQGHTWDMGWPEYNALPMIAPYMIWRALIGVLIVAAGWIGLYNVIMTVRHGEPYTP